MFYKLQDGQKVLLDRDEAIEFVNDDSVDLANHRVYDPETRQRFMIFESKRTGKIYFMRRDG